MNVKDYDYDDHTFHTLINGPDQKALFTGSTTELSHLSVHKSVHSPSTGLPIALNCKVNDGKLDMVVVTSQSAMKTRALMARAEKFAYDPARRWYSNRPTVLYLKPEEVRVREERTA